MHIILIGNYPPDKQESMQRFADMLYAGFKKQAVEVEIWLPVVVFGKLAKSTISGYGKWLGYIDKWVLFSFVLYWRTAKKKYDNQQTHFHICDHSNAPYLACLPKDTTSITCHDVLAIRGALGYADAYCPASTFGKLLQQWILKNLVRAKQLAAVSQLTFDQLIELANKKGLTDYSSLKWQVIHNAFNEDFYIMEEKERRALLEEKGIDERSPFLLHVGSALPRKNRQMLINMVAYLGNAWVGNVVFAGQKLDEDLVQLARQYQLTNRIISIVQPDHTTLVALYNACSAFVFPSFSEGFGWPLIEAQACGAPVIASNRAPLPEVSGEAALHADPDKPESFAAALLALQDACVRDKIIEKGLNNIRRFEPGLMIERYHALVQTDIITV